MMTLATGAAPGGFLTYLSGLAPILMIFMIFYLLVLMPANRQRKRLQAILDALKKGDKVFTNGGLYGEVVKAEGPVVILRIADNVKVRIARSAIAGLEGNPEDR